jgi:hypothetical protein
LDRNHGPLDFADLSRLRLEQHLDINRRDWFDQNHSEHLQQVLANGFCGHMETKHEKASKPSEKGAKRRRLLYLPRKTSRIRKAQVQPLLPHELLDEVAAKQHDLSHL